MRFAIAQCHVATRPSELEVAAIATKFLQVVGLGRIRPPARHVSSWLASAVKAGGYSFALSVTGHGGDAVPVGFP